MISRHGTFYIDCSRYLRVGGSTIIHYHIPETTTSARLDITNTKGQLVKPLRLIGSLGQVNLNTSMLASGIYNYTLYV